MDKKGVEISMNVIIVAAIGLLVLVVLSVIFLGKTGVFTKGVSDCTVQGGTCAATCTAEDIGEGYSRNPSLSCPPAGDEPRVCCIPVKA